MARQGDWKSLALKSAGMVAGAGVTGVTAWMLYSRFVLDHARPLPKAIDARRVEDDFGAFGLISHYEDTSASGVPVVLLHSVNAAASAYEMRPLFEALRGHRPVYALDLPGFGFSARIDRPYSAPFYAAAISSWVESKVSKGGPVDVVALSLTSEFAARIAVKRPGIFRSLACISPTGFESNAAGDSPRASEGVRKTLSVPLWSQAFYDALVTGPSIRHYLKKAFAGPVDEGLAQYCYETSHQPGARFAPLYFVTGKLFSLDILANFYGKLTIPCTAIYGESEYAGFDCLPDLVAEHSNWRAAYIVSGGSMPHFNGTAQTVRELETLWSSAESHNATLAPASSKPSKPTL
jgi:pimeloyl-ACP methyl ester carboxylesterase